MGQSVWDYEIFQKNTSPNINREVLLMSGLNCIVRVYITPDMPVMEVQYAVPCEAYFLSEQHTAAQEGFFTKLLNETLPKFLV
jgi:hypothetical protein